MSFHYDTEELGYESAYPTVSIQSNPKAICRGEGESSLVVYRCEVGGVGGQPPTSTLDMLTTPTPLPQDPASLMSTEPPAVPETGPNMTEAPETPPQVPQANASRLTDNKSVSASGTSPLPVEAPKPEAKPEKAKELAKLEHKPHKGSVQASLTDSLMKAGYELSYEDDNKTLVATHYGESDASGTRHSDRELRFKNFRDFRSVDEAYQYAQVNTFDSNSSAAEPAGSSTSGTTTPDFPETRAGDLARRSGDRYPSASGDVAMTSPSSGSVGASPSVARAAYAPSGGLWMGGTSVPATYSGSGGGYRTTLAAPADSDGVFKESSSEPKSPMASNKANWSNLDGTLESLFNSDHTQDARVDHLTKGEHVGEDASFILREYQRKFSAQDGQQFVDDEAKRIQEADTPHKKQDYLGHVSMCALSNLVYDNNVDHSMTGAELWKLGKTRGLIKEDAKLSPEKQKEVVEARNVAGFVGDAAKPYSKEASRKNWESTRTLLKKKGKDHGHKGDHKTAVAQKPADQSKEKPSATKPSTPLPGTVTV